MLSYNEKNHIKDVLADGLGIDRNINLAYFLNLIEEIDKRTKRIESTLSTIITNQNIINNNIRNK